MIEEDATDREHVVALAVVNGDVVAIDLGDAVRRARVERGRLALGYFEYTAVHLARRGLVNTRIGLDGAHRLEHAGHSHTCELSG